MFLMGAIIIPFFVYANLSPFANVSSICGIAKFVFCAGLFLERSTHDARCSEKIVNTLSW